jgi:hypothetical protein
MFWKIKLYNKGGTLVEALYWNPEDRGLITNEVTEFLNFQYGPGFDSACNRNKYQESSWG